ncbi:MAG: YidC/Oxa1 family membrane protein insertase, partial [Niameybacter sp.]
TFIFSKITMAASQPQTNDSNPANSMIKTMNIIMPIMMGVFSYQVANGLALYWICGNLIMMVQQIWVNKIVDKQQAVLEEQLRKDREAEMAKAGVKKKKKKRPKPQIEEGQVVIATEVETKERPKRPKKPKEVVEDQTSASKKED